MRGFQDPRFDSIRSVNSAVCAHVFVVVFPLFFGKAYPFQWAVLLKRSYLSEWPFRVVYFSDHLFDTMVEAHYVGGKRH